MKQIKLKTIKSYSPQKYNEEYRLFRIFIFMMCILAILSLGDGEERVSRKIVLQGVPDSKVVRKLDFRYTAKNETIHMNYDARCSKRGCGLVSKKEPAKDSNNRLKRLNELDISIEY